ncbi:hypothetical protein Tco_0437359, partial [Tanacetum coccineum]
PETDHLSPSYDLLKKGSFFTRYWASRNKIARSSILGHASPEPKFLLRCLQERIGLSLKPVNKNLSSVLWQGWRSD